MPSRTAKPGYPFLAFALLTLVVLTVFGRSLSHDFLLLDDDRHIYENPSLNPPSVKAVEGFWLQPYFGLFIPVTYTFWSAIAEATYDESKPPSQHVSPLAFHSANLALHLANSFLVYCILFLLFAHVPAALLGSILFALHPVQVEPVAWVSGGRDLLAATFALSAAFVFLRKGRYAIVMATPLFVLALLSKPSAATLPVALFALTLLRDRKPSRWALVTLGLWGLLGAASLLIARSIQVMDPLDFVTSWTHVPWVVMDALAFYLCKLLLPISLAFDYGRSPDWLFTEGSPGMAILGVAIVAVVIWRRSPRLLSGTALFLAPLLPMLGLAHFAFQNYSTVADRYLYLPLVGVAYLTAAAIARAKSPWPARVLVGVLVALGARSYFYVDTWHDNDTFFRAALAVNPKSKLLTNNYATVLDHRGETIESVKLLSGLSIPYPHWTTGRMNLARNLVTLGRYEEALRELTEIISFDPKLEAYCLMGGLYLKKKDVDTAAKYLEVASNPAQIWDDPLCTCAVGTLRVARKDYEGAIPLLDRTLELNPLYPNARHNLAVAHEKLGHTDRAITAYEWTLEQNPRDLDAKTTLETLKHLKTKGARPSNPGRR